MSNEQTMMGRYMAARTKAVAAGDVSLVRECDFHLERYGYRADDASTHARAEQAAEAGVKPKGRPATLRERLPKAPIGDA